jgi:hypothetical protein
MRLGKINYFAIPCYKNFEDYSKNKPYLVQGLANNKKIAISFDIKQPRKKLRLKYIIKAKIQNEMKSL